MNADFVQLIQIFTNLSVVFGVVFSYLQIKKVSSSIEVGQKANAINVLNYFAQEYDAIILEELQCRSARKVELWYLRFWSLLKNEFLFFREGLLADYIFEFWSFKMCLDYESCPKHMPLRRIETFKASHRRYLQDRNGNHPHTEEFFAELIGISEKFRDQEERRREVHLLVQKYKKLK